MRWRPIESLPKTGQALVTTDEAFEGNACDYCEIELVVCPMLPDGRILNANSGNYTRAGVWKWWMPVPSKEKAR